MAITSDFIDLCRFVAASAGTGSFVVSSAVTGYQTPASASAVNGATYGYRAENAALTEWEYGIGTYTVGSVTLARTTILGSSNGGAATNFTAAPQVAIVELSEAMKNASLLTTGLVDPNRLGSGVVGAGAKFLADNSTFQTIVSTGRLLGTTRLVATNSNVTIPAGTTWFRIRMQAAGGASAGHAAGPCGVVITGRPGGAGSFLEKDVTIVSGVINYTQGAVGTAGTSGDNPGGDAGNSTLVYNGVTYTAPGGKGGPVAATQAGAADTAIPTNGDVNLRGPGAGSFGSIDLQTPGKSPLYGGVATGGNNTGSYGGGAMGQRSASAQAGLSGLPAICVIDFYS